MESRIAVSLRYGSGAGAQRQEGGRGAELHGDAQILDRPRRKRHRTSGAEQRTAVPVRSAGSGLVARRTLYRSVGRGAGVRRRKDQGAGLQYDPQAREGRTGALVLPLRQAGHDRMAGYAQRRPRSPVADAQLLQRRGETPLGRIRSQLPQGVERDHRLPLLGSLDRRMGTLQRGVGTVQGSRNRRVDQGLRPFASGQSRQRRQPLPDGRHPRHAPLSAPAHDAARHQPRDGAGRIRRHR